MSGSAAGAAENCTELENSIGATAGVALSIAVREETGQEATEDVDGLVVTKHEEWTVVKNTQQYDAKLHGTEQY